jgi:hypothetical protein
MWFEWSAWEWVPVRTVVRKGDTPEVPSLSPEELGMVRASGVEEREGPMSRTLYTFLFESETGEELSYTTWHEEELARYPVGSKHQMRRMSSDSRELEPLVTVDSW